MLQVLLGIIAFLVIPLLELVVLIVGGIIFLRLFRDHVVPNIGAIQVINMRLDQMDTRLKRLEGYDPS